MKKILNIAEMWQLPFWDSDLLLTRGVYREFLEGALRPFLALSGLLGLRLETWGRIDGIKW